MNAAEPSTTKATNASLPVWQKIKSFIVRLSPKPGRRSNRSCPQSKGSVKLPSHAVSIISDAVLSEREAQEKISGLHTKCQSLTDAIDQLDRRAFRFDVRGHELELQDSVPNPGQIETMRESARIVRAAQKRLRDRLNDLEDELDQVNHAMEERRRDAYALLDGVLVKAHIIPDKPENATERSSDVQPTTNPVTPAAEPYTWSNEQRIVGTQCFDESRRKVLQRSVGQQNLRLLAASSPTNVEPAQHKSKFVHDPKLEAERDYKYYKLLVGQAEADFDDRQDVFDQERDQLMWKRATGESGESISQLEKQHILETRRLAQRFTKAEDNYSAAKEAAVAAGVILGSDVESGFVSRDDNGYSLSMEIDGDAFVDRGRIERWLATLSLCGADIELYGDNMDEIKSTKSGEDGVDLESVEMWETRSGVAEQPWKRRIAKWNSIRASAAIA